MVVLYVGGERVGTWAESEHRLAEFAARQVEVELRDESGKSLGRIVPTEPLCPWDPNLTKEELDRRVAAGGGMPLAEFWKKMGVR
jgi:hypothetical protein